MNEPLHVKDTQRLGVGGECASGKGVFPVADTLHHRLISLVPPAPSETRALSFDATVSSVGNLSAEIIREPQYQKLLNKTIETMHQRARSIGIEPAPDEEATNANREPR